MTNKFHRRIVSCLGCLLCASGAWGDPTSGDMVLFPGPLANLGINQTEPAAPGHHLDGKSFKSGGGWWALVCDKACELVATRMTARPLPHPVYDGEPVEGQLLQWSGLPAVAQLAPDEPGAVRLVALFKPVRTLARLPLAAGPVKTWLHAGMASYPKPDPALPGQTLVAVPGQQPMIVMPRLVRSKQEGLGEDAPEESMILELRSGDRRQRLATCESGIDGVQVLSQQDYLRWAGDLDGDGRPDLLVSCNTSITQDLQLYLSSKARPGEIVGRAGKFEYTDPAAAGC